jgi:hypothetical protein
MPWKKKVLHFKFQIKNLKKKMSICPLTKIPFIQRVLLFAASDYDVLDPVLKYSHVTSSWTETLQDPRFCTAVTIWSRQLVAEKLYAEIYESNFKGYAAGRKNESRLDLLMGEAIRHNLVWIVRDLHRAGFPTQARDCITKEQVSRRIQGLVGSAQSPLCADPLRVAIHYARPDVVNLLLFDESLPKTYNPVFDSLDRDRQEYLQNKARDIYSRINGPTPTLIMNPTLLLAIRVAAKRIEKLILARSVMSGMIDDNNNVANEKTSLDGDNLSTFENTSFLNWETNEQVFGKLIPEVQTIVLLVKACRKLQKEFASSEIDLIRELVNPRDIYRDLKHMRHDVKKKKINLLVETCGNDSLLPLTKYLIDLGANININPNLTKEEKEKFISSRGGTRALFSLFPDTPESSSPLTRSAQILMNTTTTTTQSSSSTPSSSITVTSTFPFLLSVLRQRYILDEIAATPPAQKTSARLWEIVNAYKHFLHEELISLSNGYDPLAFRLIHVLVKTGNVQALRTLIDATDLVLQDLKTFFSDLARDFEILRVLEIDTFFYSALGKLPLHLALEVENEATAHALVRLLVERGNADVNIKTSPQGATTHSAAAAHAATTVQSKKELFEAPRSPLEIALWRKEARLVTYLLEHGAIDEYNEGRKFLRNFRLVDN